MLAQEGQNGSVSRRGRYFAAGMFVACALAAIIILRADLPAVEKVFLIAVPSTLILLREKPWQW